VILSRPHPFSLYSTLSSLARRNVATSRALPCAKCGVHVAASGVSEVSSQRQCAVVCCAVVCGRAPPRLYLCTRAWPTRLI